MKKFQLTLVTLSAAVLAAGCGGGGGGSNNNTSIPTAAIQISSTNATTAASNANTSSNSLAGQAQGTTQTLGVGAVRPSKIPGRSVLDIVKKEFNRAVSVPLPAPSPVGAIDPVVLNCGTSGTVTLTFTAAGTALAVGDGISVAYSNCVDGTLTTTGSMSFAISSLSGTAPNYTSAGYTVTFTNFTSSDSSVPDSLQMNGGMTFSASVSGTITTTSITGSSFTMSYTAAGVTNSFSLYGTNGFSEVFTFDSANNAYSYSVDMTVASTEMDGSVSISTGTPFSGTWGSYPTAGVMTLTGAGGSYVTMTVNNAIPGVTLNGNDGTSNFGPTDVAWTNL